MKRAREAHAAYIAAFTEFKGELVRLERRDNMEKAQGRVVDLQWVYAEAVGVA